MAMDVPQGPGSALRFITEEPSTCFTPNFQPASTLVQTQDDLFKSKESKSGENMDFGMDTQDDSQSREAI